MFRTLARVSVHPRRTMKQILTEDRRTPYVVLVLLASLAGFFDRFNGPVFAQQASGNPKVVALTIAGLVIGAVFLLLFFLLFSWGATVLGRLVEGTGQFKDVRNALAWGLAPVIWSLLFRVPFSLFGWVGTKGGFTIDEGFRFEPGAFSEGCGRALIHGTLELVIILWCLIVSSRTLSAAHHYSPWQGLATLLMCWAVPVVVLLAFIMTSIT